MLAVIGGSGFYDWEDIEWTREITAENIYGKPSAPLKFGRLQLPGQEQGVEFCFLARHGLNHEFLPHEINYCANIKALEEQGVDSVIAVNAVGSIDSSIEAAGLVVPHQVIDYTSGRRSHFAQGTAAHIDFTEPFTHRLRLSLVDACEQLQLPVHDRGIYACTQGPRLESAAEVDRLERDGASIIGMTIMPEAVLAREIGIDYATLCISVNPAAGRSNVEITMEDINFQLIKGIAHARQVIAIILAGKS